MSETPGTTTFDINEARSFLLEDLGIRGALVRLGSTWRRIVALHEYPREIDTLLGEGLAASVLLASGLKSRPSVGLQLQGDGRLKLLLAQCSGELKVRGMAQAAERKADDDTGGMQAPLLGAGKLVVNIDTGRPNGFFQGIVPLVSTSLERCLEGYFEQSEQLATSLVLRSTADRVGGLLLQVLPGQDEAFARTAFPSLASDARRVLTDALITEPAEELLPKLFADHAIRLFGAHAVAHDCRCTPERLAGVLRMLGEDELKSILQEQGQVELNCEFCNRAFRYEQDAIDRVLQGEEPPPARLH